MHPTHFKILLVDDEKEYLDVIKLILEANQFKVKTASSGKQALKILSKESFDLVITDLIMPEMTGLELLDAIKEKYSDTEVILFTGYGSVQNAVEAMKKGAFSYFIKGHDPDELIIEIKKIVKLRKYIKRVDEKSDYVLETKNAGFKKVLDTIEKAAKSDVSILLLGESGVGKEILAQYIHQLSTRSEEAFVPVNCHAFSESLLESELFGHEKGAFTGADDTRIGRFEAADYGTLFLDEIGDTSLNIQVKLLRSLESKAIERIGSNQLREIDYRLVCATNKNLNDLIAEGQFREDLFYRISTITVTIPPLRERKEDLPALIQFFFDKIKKDMKKEITHVEDLVYTRLLQYEYPGNIRELKNIIERLVVLSVNGEILAEDLPEHFEGEPTEKETLRSYREQAEKVFIIKVLEENNYNMTKSAAALGISRRQLFNKVERYKIEK
ncbi:sigma-54-dependent Fis family transcriptional regulator [Acidaminobacter sp. JC074]|uniref:sigma-54-dependent transcriptional regulator n=1 Tax=Acidaminobacter sp. JC074 TaxID=2530199 RepID=UPI001F0E3A34|nr:sigma-54 dependent transcriptional regulator [Acidaminobacter sp. JC074]MCH4887985.1 sigma-54-dependent Fis family transcriptional regulator [Acidaminobacter sp. JC074]